jgi:hypothetical protein
VVGPALWTISPPCCPPEGYSAGPRLAHAAPRIEPNERGSNSQQSPDRVFELYAKLVRGLQRIDPKLVRAACAPARPWGYQAL